MKKILLIVFCALLFAGQGVNAQTDLSGKIPVSPNVKIGTLPNGLKYYIRYNAKPEKKVELRLAVNAGAILEDADQQGLAHFMEHMNFNGLKHFPDNELVHYLQSIGVGFGNDLNAFTGFDQTVYILPVPVMMLRNWIRHLP
jgi:zinc protease